MLAWTCSRCSLFSSYRENRRLRSLSISSPCVVGRLVKVICQQPLWTMAAYQPPDPAYNREWWPGKEEILNNIVDYMARKFPQASYAEFPRSTTSYDAGYRKVNYRTFANAINGAAWWLHKIFGPGKDFEALAYIGPNDMRYNILILAAVKAGYKVFAYCSHSHTLCTTAY